jgi:hypothetical protein
MNDEGWIAPPGGRCWWFSTTLMGDSLAMWMGNSLNGRYEVCVMIFPD